MQTVLRRSALHHRLIAAGARMRVARGWEQAESFGDGEAEARDLRGGVVLADLSAQHLVLAQAHELTAWLPAAPEVGTVALVSNSGKWVQANLKETDLTYVHPGQPVNVTVDTFPGRVWHGTIESIAPATGAQFSYRNSARGCAFEWKVSHLMMALSRSGTSARSHLSRPAARPTRRDHISMRRISWKAARPAGRVLLTDG